MGTDLSIPRAHVAHPRLASASWWWDVGAIAIYVLLAVVLFWHVWSADPATTMPVGGDQWRNALFLEWTPWAILHGANPLYSPAANYPYGVNLLVNAGSPLLGVVFSPVTLLFGPVAAFNVAATMARQRRPPVRTRSCAASRRGGQRRSPVGFCTGSPRSNLPTLASTSI